MNTKKHIPTIMRLLLFFGGIILLSALLIYAVSWNNLPIGFTLLGIEINQWVVASGMVILGLLGGAMIKSALIGSYRID